MVQMKNLWKLKAQQSSFSEGMAAQLYDEETISGFHREAACLAAQYSNYSIADSTVDGNLTLGENLADHGGLRMALAAYTQWRQDHVDHRYLLS